VFSAGERRTLKMTDWREGLSTCPTSLRHRVGVGGRNFMEFPMLDGFFLPTHPYRGTAQHLTAGGEPL
jgi:hypothetical protein